MIAICAIQNKAFSTLTTSMLEDAGYEVISIRERQKLIDTLNSQKIALILSDRMIGDSPVTDLPASYPDITWFVHLTDVFSLSAASTLCSVYRFTDFIPTPSAISNIYAAIWMFKNHLTGYQAFDSNATHAKFQSQRSSALNIPNQIELLPDHDPSLSALKVNGAQCLDNINASFFRNQDYGTFEHTHFSAIFYRLCAQHQTGRLHLRRTGLHWVIFFKDGAPFDIDMRSSRNSLDFPAWYQRKTQNSSPEISTNLSIQDRELTRREIIREIPGYEKWFKTWLTDMICEIFAWPQAEFQWMPGNIPVTEPYHPQMSAKDCMQILQTGVLLWLSEASILDVTQSVLPYFLKLNDNKALAEASFSTQGFESIVEKLKMGDTLAEMLTGNHASHIVHSVIYMLIMMGHLDLIS